MTDLRLTVTRRFEFDAAHRVLGHESKCKHIHGHRYVLDVDFTAPRLDQLGRVIDFGKAKSIVGKWLDDNWDHNLILCKDDPLAPVPLSAEFIRSRHVSTVYGGKDPYLLDRNPTAEVMVYEAWVRLTLLLPEEITIPHLRLYETPNCWADYSPASR